MKYFLSFLMSVLLLGGSLWAQPTSVWQPVANEASLAAKGGVRQIIPQQYRAVALHSPALRQVVAGAPLEFGVRHGSAVRVELPMPDGSLQAFAVRESPIMEAGLAAKFSQWRTYNGQGLDDGTASVRFGWTEKGFHAIVLSAKGTYFIDPYSVGDTVHYIVYDKKDFVSGKTYECLHDLNAATAPAPKGNKGLLKSPAGGELRTYRLALACTGEYAQFHGGTVSGALSAMVVSINRVNAIYEREVAIRMVLVANNNLLVYTNSSTDPYSNNSGGAMLGQNQTTVNSVIGSGKYDIGHVFSTGGGGIASLGSVCVNSSKARGVTGSSAPVGDPFDVDYVAHEIGHQFGGEHTFNGTKGNCSGGNREATSAYEPGSATTIMGYAGICGTDDIEAHSDPFFHTHSFDQIIAFSQTANGNTCAATTLTGNNYPNVTAGTGGYVIPANTPFELVGTATDPDGDALTYSWEQMDLGPAGAPNAPSGNAPLFRFFPPKSVPRRTFPQESDLLNNTQTLGEILPTYSRNLKFRLVARDNRAGGGGVNYDGIAFSVTENAGPFLVTTPNTGAEVWTEGAIASVTWDVANTNVAPVNCADVRILLSTDGGYTYPFVLANSVPNNGSAVVLVPTGTATATARVRVQCATGIFFDISNENFNIVAPTAPDYYAWSITPSATVCANEVAVYEVWVGSLLNYNQPVQLSIANLPSGVSASFEENPILPNDTIRLTLTSSAAALTGSYALSLALQSNGNDKTTALQYTLYNQTSPAVNIRYPQNGASGVSPTTTLGWQPLSAPHAYEVVIATDPAFINIVGQVTGSTDSTVFFNNLQPYQIYYWKIKPSADCVTNDFGETFVFSTAAVACSTYANTTPRSLLLATTYSFPITVQESFAVVDVNVLNVQGTHNRVNDLGFGLRNPQGEVVALMPRSCSTSAANFSIGFDDAAASNNYPCPPTDALRYQPLEALTTFANTDASGQWDLLIRDYVGGGGTGLFQKWTLELCQIAASTNADPVVVNNQLLEVPVGKLKNIQTATLLATDADHTAADLTFTVLSLPKVGNLLRAGNVLTVGSTFTQADLDAGLVAYAHTGNQPALDQFGFHVRDAAGGWSGLHTFFIEAEQPYPFALSNGEVRIFPNPATDLLNVVYFLDASEATTVQVFNSLGQLLVEEVFTNATAGYQTLQLPTQWFARGHYILKIKSLSLNTTTQVLLIEN